MRNGQVQGLVLLFMVLAILQILGLLFRLNHITMEGDVEGAYRRVYLHVYIKKEVGCAFGRVNVVRNVHPVVAEKKFSLEEAIKESICKNVGSSSWRISWDVFVFKFQNYSKRFVRIHVKGIDVRTSRICSMGRNASYRRTWD